MCENRGIDKAAVIDRAALLTALMMLAYGIPRERVVSHRSWTGKDCPRVLLREPGGFEAFRERAARHLEELSAGVIADAQVDGESVQTAGDDSVPYGDEIGGEIAPALLEILDLDGGTAFEAVPPDDQDGNEGRVAQLERMVGRLVLENYNLRQALEGGDAAALVEPEAA